jgi:hypothetical protein
MIQLKQATKGSKLGVSSIQALSESGSSLGFVTDGQTGSLISRETSIVNGKRGRTSILASSGDDIVSQGLSPDEFLDWVEGDCTSA